MDIENHNLLILFFSCFLLLVPPVFAGQEVVKTVTISAIENEQTHELTKKLISVAYKKIGIEVRFDDLPARRALEWANVGKTDGDLARIDGTEKKFTNLIKIQTPITGFKAVVFTTQVDRDIQSWDDLRGLSVGIIRGIRYSDIGTKGMDRSLASNMTHLFTLLAKGRIDVAVAVLDAGKIEIERNFPKSNIHIIGRPLYSAQLFHFVHNKNRELVAKLEVVFAEMRRSGEFASLRQQALYEALSQ